MTTLLFHNQYQLIWNSKSSLSQKYFCFTHENFQKIQRERERKAKEDKKCRKKRELISRTLIEINNNKLLFISTCDIKLDAIMSE